MHGQDMLNQFKGFLKNDLLKVSFPSLVDKIELLDMDSSTEDKFSHHLIGEY